MPRGAAPAGAGPDELGRHVVIEPGGKVAAIVVRVSSGWITSHGFALNVSTDLSFFEAIVPCGIVDRSVTTLESELGRVPAWNSVRDGVLRAFAEVFDRVLTQP